MKHWIHILICLLFVSTSCFSQASSAYSSSKTQSLRAYGDYAIVSEIHPQDIFILNNDQGLSEGASSLQISQAPSLGHVEVINNEFIRYTSTVGYLGTDELVYKVCNKHGECDEAKVIIEIKDFNFKPIAVADTVFLKPRELAEINVLENDEKLYDKPIHTSILIDIENGYSSVDSDGLLTTTFDTSFRGVDSCKYIISDKEGDAAEAWVFFKIKGDVKDDILIPQAMSPNGDGLNDEFKIPDLQGVPMQLSVFDALGKVVYLDNVYQNNWDGMGNSGIYSGKICDNGTYYYILKVPDFDKEFSGFIYINK
ncbi:T9SS type B sorting domain-containing protein [Labilibacter marinus]|uniref:T9SS type B sorting domain-containing protein n=1 Tax=Labilibacter marinus TaxID=1477105 RepID=UPI0009F9B211|nr:gliding motility-associated C-terminal domain-containing protein [Labilibacter marinus]